MFGQKGGRGRRVRGRGAGRFRRSTPATPASERSASRMTLRQVLLTGLEDVVAVGKTFTRVRTERRQHRDGILRGRHLRNR